MPVEQINTPKTEDNLHDLEGLERTKEWIDISAQFEWLLRHSEETTVTKEKSDEDNVISIAQDRLWIIFEQNPESHSQFIAMLDEWLNIA